MNIVEQYEAHNSYYAIDCIDSTHFGNGNNGPYFLSFDDAIYKTKFSFTDGVSINGTKGSYVVRNFNPLFNGKIKIFNNPKKIKEISINIGLSNYNEQTQTGTVRNLAIDSNILDYFTECESFYLVHYCYGSNNTDIYKGKITGEWATKCGDKLKKLDLHQVDYPLTTASFNLNLLPSNSVLEYLRTGQLATNTGNSYLNVSGDLSYIPTSCKIINLGGDRPNTTNNITGAIPVWVEEFSRLGRNTIGQNLSTLNPYIRHLSLQGSNVLSGSIPPIWTNSLNYLKILGKNTISGTIPDLSLCSTIHIEGNNTLSGNIPVLQACKELTIRGNNNMSGSIDIDTYLPSIDTLIIGGNNTIAGVIKTTDKKFTVAITGNNTISAIGFLPNCTSFTISGKNTLTGNIFSLIPSATTINITGNNTLNGYSSQSFKANMSYVNIAGRAVLTQSMVDQLLTDLAATSWLSNGTKVISIKGSCAAPSSAGLAKIEVLREKGVVVAVNV
ncbi:hypothetical protein [Epilithonimonas sp.]|uniref:hypothetical protein n=1 Tax=Epilithonimonas sp. TaxID=2894511 RepID=UPI002897AC16|nr:hypothetical protein [Epilithonimonas sp.]